MKRTFLFIMMAAVLCACGHRASTADGVDADSASISADKADVEKPALVVDTIQIERSDSMAEVSYDIQWPVDGNEGLVKSIRQFIREACNIDDEKFSGTKTAFKDIVDITYNGLAEGRNDTYDEEGGMAFSSVITAEKSVETPKFVTYQMTHSTYTGGAHGLFVFVGQTFRKSDGLKIGYRTEYEKDTFESKMVDNNLLKDVNSAKLYTLMKIGVLRYFKENNIEMNSDEELADYLQVEDINRIPLPANPPYLTTTGVMFCYTQYEIAPYAAGIISFEIPYDQILPFLTDEAKALIPEK